MKVVLSLAMLIFGAGLAFAEQPAVVVEQIIDPGAGRPDALFRFEPELVRIAPGETVRFVGTRGKHSVTLHKSMRPDGAPIFEIENQDVADIRFDQPGVYGVYCRIHSRHGMVMLIAVGDDWPNLAARDAKTPPRQRAKYDRLFESLLAAPTP